ncbi:hypothetical protein [Bhargavaea massiliensis]|uniref:hypothetical protein n=1 Tax=Bhargavaea massiliensis TaxID=2697500 RepID=UPI001BCE61B2|nr:hypothetical protein [Bhargavaea massiliensis]
MDLTERLAISLKGDAVTLKTLRHRLKQGGPVAYTCGGAVFWFRERRKGEGLEDPDFQEKHCRAAAVLEGTSFPPFASDYLWKSYGFHPSPEGSPEAERVYFK